MSNVRYSLYGAYIDYKNIAPIVSEKKQKQLRKAIEQVLTYYNNRNYSILSKIYDPYASIVVGRKNIRLSSREIELLKREKNNYISRLRRIFNTRINKELKVIFNRIEFYQHEDYPGAYIVLIYQHWESSTYNDDGWVVLVLNDRNIYEPRILYREFDADSSFIRELEAKSKN